MARIFITGSSDGLGFLAAKNLIANGHQVVLHARNEERKALLELRKIGEEAILTADLSNNEETELLAEKVNSLGHFDAIIHNAGVYNADPERILAVNVLAPYILTTKIAKPGRLIYLSSDMHFQGKIKLDLLKKDVNSINYSDSKLYVLMLSKAFARKWTEVYSNAVNPGWVPTKMGGQNAPDNLEEGFKTQVWLATSNDSSAKVNGRYFFHQQLESSSSIADDIDLQNKLLELCYELTGISF